MISGYFPACSAAKTIQLQQMWKQDRNDLQLVSLRPGLFAVSPPNNCDSRLLETGFLEKDQMRRGRERATLSTPPSSRCVVLFLLPFSPRFHPISSSPLTHAVRTGSLQASHEPTFSTVSGKARCHTHTHTHGRTTHPCCT